VFLKYTKQKLNQTQSMGSQIFTFEDINIPSDAAEQFLCEEKDMIKLLA